MHENENEALLYLFLAVTDSLRIEFNMKKFILGLLSNLEFAFNREIELK